MIPVLGVPVLNRPDLLYEMLTSIDVPIERVVIVDNGDVVPTITDANVRVIRPGANLGVSASWNLILKSTPRAAWWVFANFDLVFAPGDLARLADHMETVGGVGLLGTFAVFGLTADVVNRVGFFDENFAPAYYEDNDFDYRCRRADVPMASLPSGWRHQVSSTILSSPSYRAQNALTFGPNGDYYREKWGGMPQSETFTTPFDRGGDPRHWHLELARLASQSWIVDPPQP
jgi:GT2 family glycosyltransferase